MDHAFDHAHFCIYDINVVITAAHVKALEEGESQQKALAFFYVG